MRLGITQIGSPEGDSGLFIWWQFRNVGKNHAISSYPGQSYHHAIASNPDRR
jgi:hypothetical protein